MFHHILVPIDRSGRTTQATDMARDLGQAAGARITLFHVIETLAGADSEKDRKPPRHFVGSTLTAVTLYSGVPANRSRCEPITWLRNTSLV